MKYFYIVFLTLTIFLNFISSELTFNYNIFQDTIILINVESIFLSMKMVSAAIAFYVTNRILTLDKLHREIVFVLCQKSRTKIIQDLRQNINPDKTEQRYYHEVILPLYVDSIKNLSDNKMLNEFKKLRIECIKLITGENESTDMDVNFKKFHKKKLLFIWENI